METSFYRAIWISDTHLGGRDLQNQKLLQFLLSTESEYLYLVGDIIDVWKVKFRWFWPKINDQIIAAIINKANNGTKVFYLPGNHDEILHKYCGMNICGISVVNEVVHETEDGRRYLVLHGDQFDCVVQKKKWLAGLGSVSYDLLLIANRWYNSTRSMLGLSYHSLSASIKHRVKTAVNYVGNFEEVIVNEAQSKNIDGLICGHIHHASIKDINGVLYCNSGDWVESCTALAENCNGTLGNIFWHEPSLATAKKPEAYYEDRYRDRRLAPTN
mgnify:FL=1